MPSGEPILKRIFTLTHPEVEAQIQDITAKNKNEGIKKSLKCMLGFHEYLPDVGNTDSPYFSGKGRVCKHCGHLDIYYGIFYFLCDVGTAKRLSNLKNKEV